MPKARCAAELRAHFRYPEDLFKVQRNLLARSTSPTRAASSPARTSGRSRTTRTRRQQRDQRGHRGSGRTGAGAAGPGRRRAARPGAAAVLLAARLPGRRRPQLPPVDDLHGSQPAEPGGLRVGVVRPGGLRDDPRPAGAAQQPAERPRPGRQPVPVRAGRGRVAVPVPAEPRRGDLRQPADAPGRQGAAVRPARLRPGAGRRELPDAAARAGELRQRGRREHHAGPVAGRPVRRPHRYADPDADDHGRPPAERLRDRRPACRRRRVAIREADAAFQAGQDALRRNDFAAYGAAQDRLRRALDQLAASQPSPAPSR